MLAETCTKCGTPLKLVANGTMALCPRCKTMTFANNDGSHENLQDLYVRSELMNGEDLLFEQKWQEAITCFSKMAKSHPLQIDAWMGLARALTREQENLVLSSEEYKLLCKCLGKIQVLSGALLDDSWRAYRDKYEAYRETQRRELQAQCDKLANWVDHKQDGDSKMAARIGLLGGAFLILMLGIVMFVVDARLWYLIPITGTITGLLGYIAYRTYGYANLTKEERQAVQKRCAELNQYAKYWNVELYFRQDIRNIIESHR